jgi:hypothetical protein
VLLPQTGTNRIYVLRVLEAEAAEIADGTHALSFPRRTVGRTCILNEQQTVPLGDAQDGIQIG